MTDTSDDESPSFAQRQTDHLRDARRRARRADDHHAGRPHQARLVSTTGDVREPTWGPVRPLTRHPPFNDRQGRPHEHDVEDPSAQDRPCVSRPPCWPAAPACRWTRTRAAHRSSRATPPALVPAPAAARRRARVTPVDLSKTDNGAVQAAARGVLRLRQLRRQGRVPLDHRRQCQAARPTARRRSPSKAIPTSAAAASTTRRWARSAEAVLKSLALLGAGKTRGGELGKEAPGGAGQRRGGLGQNRRAELPLIGVTPMSALSRPSRRSASLVCSCCRAGRHLRRRRGAPRHPDLRQKLEASNAATAEQAELNVQPWPTSSQLKRSLLDLNNQLEACVPSWALRGRNEQLARDVAELQRRRRMAQGHRRAHAQSSSRSASRWTAKEFLADPPRSGSTTTPSALIRGRLHRRSAGLSRFLRRYPQMATPSRRTFWLGNAQYGRRQLQGGRSPRSALLPGSPAHHQRAPEAVLAIANCQIELKDNGRPAQDHR